MATNGNNSKNYTFKNTNVMEAKILKLTDAEFRRVVLKSASVVFLSALLFLFNLLNVKAANYYWVGNSGNWNDVSHWATTSGGTTFHTVLPGVNDDVFFDDNSFSFSGTDTVFVFSPTIPTCRNFSFVNSFPTPRGGFASNSFGGHGISFQIRGNLEVSGPIANYGFSNNDVILFTLWSTQPVQFIQTSGNRMNIDLFSSNTATYNLLDDLDGSFLVRNGRLNTNGHTLNITSFLSRVEYQGIIDFGNSTINSLIDSFNSFEVCCGGRIIADNATFNLPISDFVHNYNTTFPIKVKQINARNIYAVNDTIGVCNSTGIIKASATFIKELNLNGTSASFFNDTSYLSFPPNHIGKCVMNADTNSISGLNTGLNTEIDTLILNTSCKNLILKSGYNTTINSLLEINTTTGSNTTIQSDASGLPSTITKTSGALCFDNLNIKDVIVTGGAQFFAGANSANLGGNTGWNFTACPPLATAYYWVGGTGNWSDVSHWATSSGGTTFHTQPPTANDDVYFDGNSFTSLGQVVYADASSPLLIPCKNFNCTGVTNSPSILLDSTVSHSMNVYGSFILSPNLTYGYGLTQTIFLSGGNSNTILTSGKIIDAVFNGAGSWTLADSLTTYNFELVSGTLNLSGHTLRSLSNIFTYPQSILNTGSSKIFADWILLNGLTTNVNYSNFIVSGYNGISSVSYLDNVTLTDMASAGNLNCRKITGEISASNSPYLVGGNVTCDSLVSYHNISIGYSGISGLIKTMIAYDDLHLYNGCAFDSLLLFNANDSAFIDSGAVITINDIILCNATASLPISISSTVSGLSGFILHQSGINCLNYLNIRDIQASGGAQFFAGANSVDLGGNSGWNFTSCTQAANSFYWVGGTGNWSDVSHWATTSGGTTFHTTPPDSTSDVYFDGNSSLTTNDTIYTPSSIISCRNFTSANITSAFHFGYPFSLLTVHGSLNINPYLVFISAAVNMLSNNSGNTIQTNGNNSISNLVFTGGGEWSLLDSLYVVSNISISDFCTVNLNSNNITSGVDFNLSPQAILNTGSATLTAVEFYFDTGIVNGTGSRLITTTGGGASYLNGTGYDIIINNYQVIGNFTCNKIYCYYPGGQVYGNFNSNYLECHNHCYLDSSGYVGRAVIYDDADIGNLTFDTLILYTPGSSIRIMQDDTITINNALIANSVSGNTISISTLPAGSSGYINKSSGQICLQNVSLQNINTTGGAQFFAGNGCIDLGGNTGWIWAPCSPSAPGYYWVGGTGNWSDVSHWATTSGGGTFHTLPPDSTSDVYFDVNSFSSTSTVSLVSTGSFIECRNFICSGLLDSMQVNNGLPLGIKIYGSVMLDSLVFFNNSAYMNLVGGGTNYFRSNCSPSANNLTNLNLFFDCGQGRYDLIDGYTKVASFKIASGRINTRGLTIESPDFSILNSISSIPGSNLQVNFESSELKSSFNLVISNTFGIGGFIDLDSAYINIQGALYGQNIGHVIYKVNANDVYIDQFTISEVTATTFFGNGNIIEKMNCSIIRSNNSSSLGKNYINILSSLSGQYIFNGSQTVVNVLKPYYNSLSMNQFLGVLTQSGDSLFVLNYLNADTGYFRSLTSGQLTYFVSSAPQICFQNMTISDVNASGAGLFYAGNGCINAGGNSGFIWSPCSPLSDVWPGDANYDLTVNNYDVLNIGLAYGNTGPLRTGASLAYVAQPATDWSGYFANAVNHKHADTNGDGVVDNNDTAAISLNYGLTHPARLAGNTQQTFTGPQLYLQASADSVAEGDTVEFDIYFGDAVSPINNIYGLAFTINVDTTFVDTVYSNFDFTGCWMGTEGVDLLTYNHPVWSQNKIDVALTRTTQTDTSGFGYLGRVGVVIVDNVGARILSPGYVTMPVSISNVYGIDYAQNALSITTLGDSVVIDTAGTVNINNIVNLNNAIDVFPNPTKDKINVRSSKINIESAELINTLGSVLIQTKAESNSIALNLELVRSGIYVLRIKTDKGVLNKKVQVIKYK